jgi:hypothetical protein
MSARRVLGTAVVVLAVAAALVLAATAYEVLSLGGSLTRVVKELRGRPVPPVHPGSPRAPRDAGPGAGREVSGSGTWETQVSFTLLEEDLAGVLRRRDRWLAGALAVTRDVSCRLDDGHVTLETRNAVRALGLPIANYAGFSDWGLTLLPGGVGIRLHALRLAGVEVPGAAWLVRRFGPSQDGWIVVRTGGRHRVDRVEVDDGKLSVSGTLRGRG